MINMIEPYYESGELLERVMINEQNKHLFDKPVGEYLTLKIKENYDNEVIEQIVDYRDRNINATNEVLIVGLGNSEILSDSLGTGVGEKLSERRVESYTMGGRK